MFINVLFYLCVNLTLSLSSLSALALALRRKTPCVSGATARSLRSACSSAGGGVPLHSRVSATPKRRPPRRSRRRPLPPGLLALQKKSFYSVKLLSSSKVERILMTNWTLLRNTPLSDKKECNMKLILLKLENSENHLITYT